VTRLSRIVSWLVVPALALGAVACGASGAAGGDAASSSTSTTVPTATLTDQPYAGPSSSASQVLDLWVPDGTSAPSPLVVFIHGGGWVEGDRGAVASKRGDLLDAGFAVASIDYRLSDEARFPAAVQDAKAAVRWLRANAVELGVDPDRFASWGESAGGHLAAMVGVTGDQPTLFDDPTLADADTSSAVQAVVDWFGPVDLLQMQAQARNDGVCADPYDHDADDSFESKWLGRSLQDDVEVAELADPITYIPTAGVLPPFSIAHGDDDCIVDVDQSRLLAGALEAAGRRPQLLVLRGASHMDARFDAEVLDPTIDWLRQVLGP
jgi:acetyl esterase/lipase